VNTTRQRQLIACIAWPTWRPMRHRGLWRPARRAPRLLARA
jgi:hypothetical protein